MNWLSIYWTGWLFVAIPISFGIFEAIALSTNRTTLSRYVWNLTAAWPPFGWVAGVVTGGLAVHFFWTCQGCPLPVSAALSLLTGG